MTTHTLDDYLNRLQGVTKSGDEWKALCPAHDDRNPSLSIGPGKNGRPVLHCHAGCSYDAIITAMGFDWPDTRQPSRQPTQRKIVGTYDYRNEQGVLLYQKVRYEPKGFLSRKPDGNGWLWKLGDIRHVLYRLPELLQAKTDGETIFVSEGEKDADRLHLVGLAGTTNVEGASRDTQRQKWLPEYTETLAGCARIVLLPDADEPGRARVQAIAAALAGKVGDIRIVELPGAKDVSDWLDAGHTVEELLQRVEATAPYRRPADTEPRQAVAPIEQDAYRGTDDGNAGLFLGLHGQDIRYCPPWEKWLLWTGTHWRIDDRLDIDRLAADIPRLLYRQAADARDTAHRRQIADLARKMENTTKRRCMLVAARHRVVVHHSDLDKGRMLLNAINGTVDLETGKLRNHARTDLLTHDTEILYSPDATAPTWLQFLTDVFRNDADLIDFVQRAVGYSLTGDVREQALLICYGAGSNGKSVFLNILRHLLGSLSWQAAPDLLLQDKHRRHPTEQADLFGKRLVICQETGEGQRFNEELVKQLTGGDAITARRMHEDNWSFEPTHKLWLSTNHKPEIRGTDYAIWRRIRLIPFAATFREDTIPRKDTTMEARLLEELPGILAWAVAGCLAWQRDGLRQANAVRQATEAYRAEMDVLAGFLADCCVIDHNVRARASSLYAAYTHWCEQNGEYTESQRKFGQRLAERGYSREKSNSINWWRGIELQIPDSIPFSTHSTLSTQECIKKSAELVAAGEYTFQGTEGYLGTDTPPTAVDWEEGEL